MFERNGYDDGSSQAEAAASSVATFSVEVARGGWCLGSVRGGALAVIAASFSTVPIRVRLFAQLIGPFRGQMVAEEGMHDIYVGFAATACGM